MCLEKLLPVVALLVVLMLGASVAGAVLTLRKRARGFEAPRASLAG